MRNIIGFHKPDESNGYLSNWYLANFIVRQNSKLREQLLSTGNDILAECAVQDVIWGIGLSMSDSKRYFLN